MSDDYKCDSGMEWHESLLQLFSRQGVKGGSGEEGRKAQARDVVDLLVVDNAKVHRSLHESESTVADTQLSPSSSVNGDELSVLFEEVDLYDDDHNTLHNSFPVTTTPRSRRRHRTSRNALFHQQIMSKESALPPQRMTDILQKWGSSSDSLLDYNSLDDMLREENSQTLSTMMNVFQPARRRSVEVDFVDLEDMSEGTYESGGDEHHDDDDDDDEMDRKPAPVPTTPFDV